MALTRTFIPLVTFGAVVPVSGWGEVPVVRCSHDSKDSSRKKWGNVGERAFDKDVHLVIHTAAVDGQHRLDRERPPGKGRHELPASVLPIAGGTSSVTPPWSAATGPDARP